MAGGGKRGRLVKSGAISPQMRCLLLVQHTRKAHDEYSETPVEGDTTGVSVCAVIVNLTSMTWLTFTTNRETGHIMGRLFSSVLC